MSTASTGTTHPDAGLCEVGPHGYLLPRAHVRVAIPLESGLQFLQLLAEDICGASAENICFPPARFLPTDSGLEVSDTVCTSDRCLESTDRCSGCKVEAIATAVWCVEASLFPVTWWWWWWRSVFNGSLIEFIAVACASPQTFHVTALRPPIWHILTGTSMWM
ncbi:hypothetical protein EYF80_018940 [Liparis tanakae]|uniref:Uncharacterized protein n=1 Tax=Liparis tanakae TaxID=230148 RepID=A0A4Z2HY84_9TELE|nr:hypothetical protein EYF80_018940 [Liparis tanakae]